MSDFVDRLKKIPPWGWGGITIGVLGLMYMNRVKSANNAQTPVINPVDPSAETAMNDQANRMQNLYLQLSGKLDQTNQNLNSGLANMAANNASTVQSIDQNIQGVKDQVDVLYNPIINTGLKIGAQAQTDITHAGSWYTVQQGDTIANIASRAYSNKPGSMTTSWITADNSQVAQNGLQEGQKIWLRTG